MRFAALLAFLLIQDPAPVALRWNLAPGKALRYEFALDAGMDFGGLPVEHKLILGLAMVPGEADEQEIRTLQVTVDRVKIDAKGFLETDYDSDVDEEPPDDVLGAYMAAVTGSQFTMKLSRRGEIVEVKGFDAILKAASKKVEGGGGAARHVRQLLADGQIRALLQQASPVLPDKPVAVGTSWEGSGGWSFPMFGRVKLSNTTTLREVREGGREALIRQESTAKVSMDEDAMFEVTKASSSAEFEWLIESGLLKAGRSTTTLSVDAQGQDYELLVATRLTLAPRAGPPPKKPKAPPKKKNDEKEE